MKRKLNLKRLFIFIGSLVLLIVIALISVFMIKLSPTSKTEEIVLYNVELGKGTNEVFDDLERDGFIKSSFAMKLYSKLKGGVSIDAGSYNISKSYGSKKIFKILSEKNSINADEISFTLKEGENVKDLIKIISEKTEITKESFESLFKDKDYLNELINKYWFLTEDILNKDIYYSLEGYLFPDTYRILKTSEAKDVIEKMLNETENKLKKYKNDIEKNSLSIHEIMTLASIIELEGAGAKDRNGIAGVYMNRINNDWNLGCDATTYYAVGISLYERDLYQYELDDCSNKYNTRCKSYIGLPVGPICNASLTSIEASIYPEENDYYYYVSDKDGKVYFAKTYNEHLNLISKLQREGLWYER